MISPHRIRICLALLVGLLMFRLFTFASAQTAAVGAAPAHIIMIVADGTGFPFEDPTLSRYPALNRLRMKSRPFDQVFANDASWAKTDETLLDGLRGKAPSGLVAALKARRFIATSVNANGVALGAFDRAVKGGPAQIAGRALEALDAAGTQRAFVFASLDLRNLPGGSAGNVDSPPLEIPAISIFDRGPLDPVGFRVIPPPRDPADRRALAGRRDAAFRALDLEVGALLQGIEKRGLTSKVAIALVSIGPAPRPERPTIARTDLLFEDWLRGFALISVPGTIAPGTASVSMAQMADIAPTLAELAGAALPRSGGVSLAAAVRDPKVVVRSAVLSDADRQAPKVGRTVRTQRFRYTQWPDGSEELFNEDADPREWKNLADVPAMQAQKAELAKRLVVPGKPAAATPARASSGRRPNVLMIIADDLTAQYGDFGHVKTPNLDRLRARGRVYTKAYAPAPFCTPSRAAFLSGMSPARLELQQENAFGEVFKPPSVSLIQEQFKSNGYYTVSVGKVWDSQPGEKRGWDINEWLPPLPPGMVEAPAQMMKNMPVEAGPTTNQDEAEGDGRRARFAVKILEEKREKPLFLALGFIRPHVAWIAPQKYFDMYPPAQMKFTPAPVDDTSDIPAIAIKNRPQVLPGLMLAGREPGGFSNDPAEARRGMAAYLACVTFMDAQLGLVLDAMDKNDLWKDTIVVFFGDNGHHFGDHGGLWRKNTLFEESLRVPMIITTPYLAQPGASTKALADLIDVYPTLVDLTGIARPSTLDGVSLTATLKDPAASVQDALVQYRPTEPSKTGYSLRTSRYRYTLWPDGSEELYDVSVDPAGRRDLSHQPTQAANMLSLRKRIEGMVK